MVAASRERVVRLGVLAAVLALSASCVSEKTVYRDVTGPTPPAAAGNFAGYARNDTKQTVCGNCHFDLQTAWVQTGHASAWQNLMASGHASDACKDCHSVSANGNGATTKVGYSATQDPRYQDVQCESCHGGGWLHVKSPTIDNRPLASIAVDETEGSKFGCGGCHSGAERGGHEPFVDQWKVSAHAYVDPTPSSPDERGSCGKCHVGQDALAALDTLNTNYVERNSTTAQPIVCVVCHDPHAKKNDKQLRFSVSTADTSKNLCMKCHNRSQVANLASSRGMIPHAPETGTLLGYAGWFVDSLMTPPSQGGAVIATHGSAANANTCATCHVSRYQVTDANGLVLQATGHTFNATPCLDSLDRPLAKDNNCDASRRSFKSCVASGCHGSEAVARSALVTATNRIQTLAETILDMYKNPTIAADTLKSVKNVARGAMFNARIASGGHSEEVLDRMGGNIYAGPTAHNPFLLEQLLTNSIKAMQKQYPTILTPATTKGLVLDNILQKH